MNESFKYDANGNLKEARDDDTGESVRYEYDENGQVVKETFIGTDGSTTDATSYSYDSQGNVVSETSTNGSSPTSNDRYKYDDFGRLIAEVDANSYLTTHTYDALDREIKTAYYLEKVASGTFESSGDALTETREYDKNGNLLSEKDREGRIISYTYDNMDRITSKTISKGEFSKIWTYAYSTEDVVCEFESGSVAVQNASVTRIINPDGAETSVTVKDKAGNIVKTIENGLATSIKYSKDGDLTEIYTVGASTGSSGETLGLTVLANYDKFGNNTSNIVNPSWNGDSYYVDDNTQVYRYTYDSLGNVLKRIDPKGSLVSHKYDSNGRITHTTTAAGTENSSEKATAMVNYDIQTESGNTITKVTNSMGQQSETETDPSGNTVRISDIGLNNPSGRRIEVFYEYDALGNLIKESNANGRKTYSYDGMNNMIESISVTNSEDCSATEKSTYTYDRFGAMTSRKDYKDGIQTSEARYGYDSLKRLSKYYTGSSLAEGQEPDWIEYSYDIEDNLTEIKYPSFMQIDRVSYSYDAYNRVTSVKMRTDNSSKDSLVREYEYRSDNRVASVKDYSSDKNYIKKSFEYDDLGRCTAIYANRSKDNRLIESFNYTYDKCNNITSEEMMHDSGETKSSADEGSDDELDPDLERGGLISEDGSYHIRRDYTYNELSELTKVLEYRIPGADDDHSEELIHFLEYTYDKIGSRTSETEDGIKSIYHYDSDGLNQLTKVTVEGDSDGNKTKTYSYDAAGNLTYLDDRESSKQTSYIYNVNGDLVSAVVRDSKSGDSTTTENTYDGSGTRIAKTVTKRSSDGQVSSSETINYYVSGNNLISTYSEDGDNSKQASSENIYGIDGKIINTFRPNGDAYIYTTDLRGSTTSVVGGEGTTECVYYYDIYGEPETWKKDNLFNEIMYTGAVYDESTGLLYLRARYYDASNGRFISEDTYRGEINNPLSLNLYGYCNGNPINQVDEDGHLPTVVICAIGGAFMGAGIDIAMQIWTLHREEKEISLKNINWKSVRVSAAEGALSGALAGATGGASLVGKRKAAQTALEFGIGFVSDIGYQQAEGVKEIDYTRSLTAAATSVVVGKISLNRKKTNLLKPSSYVDDAKNTIKKKGWVSTPKSVKPRVKKIKKKNYQSKKAYRRAKGKVASAAKKSKVVQTKKKNRNTFVKRVTRVVRAKATLAGFGSIGIIKSKATTFAKSIIKRWRR